MRSNSWGFKCYLLVFSSSLFIYSHFREMDISTLNLYYRYRVRSCPHSILCWFLLQCDNSLGFTFLLCIIHRPPALDNMQQLMEYSHVQAGKLILKLVWNHPIMSILHNFSSSFQQKILLNSITVITVYHQQTHSHLQHPSTSSEYQTIATSSTQWKFKRL